MPDTGSGIVYHYCSLEAFKSIIENKCLWLCDVEKSNDSAERQYFHHILMHTVNECLTKRSYARELKKVSKYALQCLHAFQFAMENITEFDSSSLPLRIFSASFSFHGDQLSQWRGYADDGLGISIGFNNSILCSNFSSVNMGAINYSYSDAQATSYNLIKNTLSAASQTGNQFDTTSSFVRNLIDELEYHGVFFKSNSFKEENEYRLVVRHGSRFVQTNPKGLSVYIPGYDDACTLSKNPDFPFTFSPKKYRISNHQLSAYYELSFEKVKNRFIRRIYIGPKCPISPEDIKMFFLDCGYILPHFPILHSSATYR